MAKKNGSKGSSGPHKSAGHIDSIMGRQMSGQINAVGRKPAKRGK